MKSIILAFAICVALTTAAFAWTHGNPGGGGGGFLIQSAGVFLLDASSGKLIAG